MKSKCTKETLAFLEGYLLLDQLFTECLESFKYDYKTLCEHHYPTIHNRGMSPVHLSAAFNRRLLSVLKKNENPENSQLHIIQAEAYRYICSLDTNKGHSDNKKLWLLYPQFLNAKTEAKSQISASIEFLFESHEIQQLDYICIICDHWFDRTTSSKELYYWWKGLLPKQETDYESQGIHNLISKTTLNSTLESRFNLSCVSNHIIHPLESNSRQCELLKYLLCTAVFQLNKD
ncbi:hypothetical protein VSAL_II0597 [Aliivibrio salmonicida LFI1238]|uniref:Uncharacterized protein n=1 Tax=Aliivibrio salmonicida (strain LFI1238) TaxID=316275 RepID=B6ERL8_ALISL|nr:hypothetical protein VSAL_II0597 [Aliivibrio salmonicida LFI1238]